MGVARDTYKRDAPASRSSPASRKSRSTPRRAVPPGGLHGDRRLGHHHPPARYGGQLLGRAVLGMSHALALKTVYDQHYGLSLTQRFYQSRPPTILDIPRNMKWEA